MTQESSTEPDLLVGRSNELKQLEAAIELVRSGHRHLVVARGEAGVGKTRLLDELTCSAAASGFKLLRARADEFDSRVPLAPLRLALGAALREEQSPRLADDAQRLLTSLDFRRRHDSDAAGSQLFELLLRVMSGWADRTPTLLAIDDVHAADPDTIAALGFVGRHTDQRLLVAVTTRTRPPDVDVSTSALLERLAAAGETTTIDLDALDVADTRELVARAIGEEVSDDAGERIWRSTGGNPFFAVELIRSLSEQGMFAMSVGAPVELRDDAEMSMSRGATVLDRIARLGPDAVAVARVISVLPEVDVGDLSWVVEMIELPQDRVSAAFDLLVGAGVLTGSRRGYEFAHPIVRETVYRHLGPTERDRLHRSIATLRLAQHDLGRAVDIADIARHLKLAGSSDEAACEAFVMAGDRVIAEAPRSAIGWYRDALAAMATDSPRRGRTLGRLARALLVTSQHAESAEAARAALNLLPPGKDLVHTIHVLFGAYQRGGEFDAALDLVARHADDPAVMTQRLSAQRAQMLLWHDRIDEAGEVLDGLNTTEDEAADSLIEGVRVNMMWSMGRDAEAKELARHLERSLEQSGGLRRIGTLVALASCHAYNGYPKTAARWLDELDDQVILPGTIAPARVATAFGLGHWDEALALTASLGSEPGEDHALWPIAYSFAAHILAERADRTSAIAMRARLEESTTFPCTTSLACGHIDLALGETERARDRIAEAFERHLAIGRFGQIGRAVLLLAEIELAAGDEDAASRALERVDREPLASSGCRDRVAIETARCLLGGDPVTCFEAAEDAAVAGMVSERARALLAAGAASGDAESLIEAANTFRELGVPAREREAIRALRALGRRMPRVATDAGALTDGERRLAELVTSGLTNRQIAGELHLSPKTIEVYLTRLYAKVGCRSRVDLAVAVKSGQVSVDTPN